MKTILIICTLLFAGCGSGEPNWFGGDSDTDGDDTDTSSSDSDTDSDTDVPDSGTDSGTDSDTDSDSDSDTDTDTDTNTDTEETDPETYCPVSIGALDATTNLCWQVVPASYTMDKADAVDYCEALVLGDRDDWYLPSRDEYLSIFSGCSEAVLDGEAGYCSSCTASPICFDLLGTYGASGCFWMSTYVSPGVAWGICMDTGSIATGPDTNPLGSARCVRNGE